MLANKTEHLLKCVALHRKFINNIEIQHVLNRNIAATSL